MIGWAMRVPESCTDCDGRLTVIQDSSAAGLIILHCPNGHETLMTWPSGKPELMQVTSPAAMRSYAEEFRAFFRGRK